MRTPATFSRLPTAASRSEYLQYYSYIKAQCQLPPDNPHTLSDITVRLGGIHGAGLTDAKGLKERSIKRHMHKIEGHAIHGKIKSGWLKRTQQMPGCTLNPWYARKDQHVLQTLFTMLSIIKLLSLSRGYPLDVTMTSCEAASFEAPPESEDIGLFSEAHYPPNMRDLDM